MKWLLDLMALVAKSSDVDCIVEQDARCRLALVFLADLKFEVLTLLNAHVSLSIWMTRWVKV